MGGGLCVLCGRRVVWRDSSRGGVCCVGVGRCVLCGWRVVWRDRSREVCVVCAEGCVEGQE